MRSYRNVSVASALALVLAAPGFATPGFAQTADTQTRTVGPQPDGSIVASDNQLLTPAGKIVQLGSPVRAKQVAINPNAATHTAAVLLENAAEPIIIFDVRTGQVLQRFAPQLPGGVSTDGSFTGLVYSADGSKLLFSQDQSDIMVLNVSAANGFVSQGSEINVPAPNNPNLYTAGTANPGGLALVNDTEGLVALNASNAVGVFNPQTGAMIATIPVGNAPTHIALAPSSNEAYVTNEGGRTATASDYTAMSDGTPMVANPQTGSATTGTVSVINTSGNVAATIPVGLRPAGIQYANGKIYVANAYSDTISVIDTATNKVVRTIPVKVPSLQPSFGAGANDIAVVGTNAYVTLGQSNAIAVLDLTRSDANAVIGYIPTLYFPTSIAYDASTNKLVVSDDKGTGAQGSLGKAHGVTAYNTHQDTGTVDLIPIPNAAQLTRDTVRVVNNNDWLSTNALADAKNADKNAAPVAIPLHIGEPSLIKHVFYIIKENRTYDQMLGDVAQGNGDPAIAVFAGNVPNQHAFITRFPLLDNLYAPSRQSADGHPWTIEAGSFYSNDIQSPDWVRSYPGGNDNDALTFTPKGYIWTDAVAKGESVKIYGEWSDGSVVANNPATGKPYTWADFYNTHLYNMTNGAQGKNIVPPNSDSEQSQIPAVQALLDPHYPSFNLGIPDQYRADYYIPQLQAQDAAGAIPNLTVMWLPDDHTNGTTTGDPLPNNYEADNDLALGRIVSAISNTKAWPSTAIFVTEDDSQDGVDHVDGHREPAYVISPYAAPPQTSGVGKVINTTYTVVNMERTIENILGLKPMTQFDRLATPMFDAFTNTPDDAPVEVVPANTALNIGPGNVVIAGTGPANFAMNTRHVMGRFERAWELASDRIMRPNMTHADIVDEHFLNHAIWYSATGWTRAYPGEKAMLMPSAFRNVVKAHDTDD